MNDPRFEKLAALLVRYSTSVKKGERVLIELTDVPDEFGIALMREVRSIKADPFITIKHI